MSKDDLATGGVVQGCPLAPSDGCWWPKPNGALVLGPNDKLVVSLPGATPGEFDLWTRLLGRALGDRVVLISGATQIASLAAVPHEGGNET